IALLAGDPYKAELAFQDALAHSLPANRKQILFRLAAVYAMQQRFDEAFVELRASEEAGYPIERDVRLLPVLAEYLDAPAFYPEALDYALQVLDAFPKHEEVLVSAAILYARSGQITTSNLLMDMLAEKNPEWASMARQRYGALLPAD
ncbi:MAG: hypothetical protein KJ864_04290, partial [Candidatus Omnitrophica bacterium]|nr:hypothetical protein [Candidatus Omnitrophota bacterium]